MSLAMQTPKGKTLVIGPSRAGKSYFCKAFKAAGLHSVDLDVDTALIKWRSDKTGEPVERPGNTPHQWYASHHFLIIPGELKQYLAAQGDVIVFAHCWNIMDVLDLFDRVVYMSLPKEEMERRLAVSRPDHPLEVSQAELDFFRKRHQERSRQARERNIPFIDATLTPEAFYTELTKIP